MNNIFMNQDNSDLAKMKREFYARYDLQDFRKKVSGFWSRPLPSDVDAILDQVLEVANMTEKVHFPFTWEEYLPGTVFLRVRKVSAEKFQRGFTVKDLWEAPKEYVPAGRLNQPEEPLLYTCIGDPHGPMFEAGLKPDDYFILVEYKLRTPIYFKKIGVTDEHIDLTPREREIEEVLSTFIRDVLTIPAGEGPEDLYTLTQKTLESFFPFDEVIDGWTFESTLRPPVKNAVIAPSDAHSKLEVNSVIAALFSLSPSGDAHPRFLAFSDGTERVGDKIGFQSIPPLNFTYEDEIYDWVEAAIQEQR